MDRVPPYDDLLWPTLKAVKALGGSGSNEELLGKVIELERIPEHIQSQIHSDNRSTKLAYNLAWAKTYLKKVGALENSGRGVWSLTDAGERLTPEQCRDIPAIVRRDEAVRRLGKTDALPAKDPVVTDTAREIEQESWKDRLLAVLRAMQPSAFERLAQRILREAGFIKVEVTGASGDGGIDGVGVLRVICSRSRFCFSASVMRARSARERCVTFAGP